MINIEMKYDLFISYCRRDIEKVRIIKSDIESSTKLKCWMDLSDIESGSFQFAQYIVDGINNSSVFLFMLSNESQKSKVALSELWLATKKAENDKKKHVVIVNIDGCKMTDYFELLYGQSDTINWTDQLQKNKLFKDIKRWKSIKDTVADAINISMERLQGIEEELLKSVLGKDKEIKKISDTIVRNLMRYNDTSCPIASVLFDGANEMEVTKICRSISNLLYNDPNQIVYFDMSEYQQFKSIYRLFGCPPGYPGEKSDGLLTEAIINKPLSVVYLDNIEFVHPKIAEILIQILDSGKIADGKGKLIDFNKTIIVMRSHIIQNKIPNCLGKSTDADQDTVTTKLIQQIKNIIASELVNRIDEFVHF